MGRFVTFEGIEGSGKTTQIRMACDFLTERAIPFVKTDEPGGTPLGKMIREMLLNIGPYPILPRTELLLFIAARAQHVHEVILPTLERECLVLCDRFLDATIAYQGYGRGLDIGIIRGLHNFASASLVPDLTFLFDLPVETGLKRALDRIACLQGVEREDRFEREDLQFHQRVREGYIALAAECPERYCIIDASRDAAAVHEDVSRRLSVFLGG